MGLPFSTIIQNNNEYDVIDKATQGMIAQPFDANKSGGYAVDDVVIYANKLYKFTSAHTGAWTGLDVEQVDITELMPFSNVIRVDLNQTSTLKTVVTSILASLQAMGVTDLTKIEDCQLRIHNISSEGIIGLTYRLQNMYADGLEMTGTDMRIDSSAMNIYGRYLKIPSNPSDIFASEGTFKITSANAVSYSGYKVTTNDTLLIFSTGYVEFIWR